MIYILRAEVEALPVLFKVSYYAAVNVGCPVIVVNEVIVYLFHPDCVVISGFVETCFPDNNRVSSVSAVFGVKMLYPFPSRW